MTPVDLDRPVADRVHLASLPGAVEPLLQQCHDLGAPLLTGIRRTADAVVADLAGPLRPIAALRLYAAFGIVLGDDPVATLQRSRETGVLSVLDAQRFRVGELPGRRALTEQLASGLGWTNDPGDYDVNVEQAGRELVAQVGPLFRSRRFPAMARLPASANPVLAALVVKLAKIRADDVVLDPFCGAATMLVEAAAVGAGAVLVGSDVDPGALRAAGANAPLIAGGVFARADAAHLPYADGVIDRVVTNMPFGKLVGSHTTNLALYPAFAAELGRVLRADGRAVLMTEEKTLLNRSVADARGLKVVREVKLATPGGELHPSAFVVERTRAARRRHR
ncbi:TRM11 family SAM-dependent methyltransferase [Pseudonocardia sp. CA-107938]|uniref:TRM11 family SAM-dependent methyltransferase n=1 Tax=Pseudonocardia sp. CA-107938 TaxID=3240021 RepID=UPI003D8BF7EB